MSCQDIFFLTKIYSMETTPDECISEVRSLLSCPSKACPAKRLEGDEAKMFIDCLDQVLTRLHLDDKLRLRGIRLIRKISKAQKILPSSYILQGHVNIESVYFFGGSADVSKGEYQGRTVAVKRLRTSEGDSNSIFKRLCREVMPWKNLSHPNLLPLLGVSVSSDPHSFRIFTEWMPNGNVMQYARSNPTANRLHLLTEVLSGVTYLHDLKIVHGDLKGANILVDNTGSALIADLGLMSIIDVSAFISESGDSFGGTFRWMSPELLDPESLHCKRHPTLESDRYALGMVIYEVLTGLKPFHHMPDVTFVPVVVRGGRPEKPPNAETLGLSDTLWGLVQSCWSRLGSTRPTAQELLDHLSFVSPTWDPLEVIEYPVVVTDVPSISDSDLSSPS